MSTRKLFMVVVGITALCFLQIILHRPGPSPAPKPKPKPQDLLTSQNADTTTRTVPPPEHTQPATDTTSTQLSEPEDQPQASTHGLQLPGPCELSATFAEYIRRYLENADDREKNGMIVWTCPVKGRCGGLGDKMKGIASTFLIALLLNRNFGVLHDSPTELHDHVVPNLVQWDSFVRNRTYPVVIHDRPPPDGKDVLSKAINKKIFYMETNQDLVSWLHSLPAYSQSLHMMGIDDNCMTLSCIYGCLNSLLFKPAPTLEKAIREKMVQHPRYVSVQIRMGSDVKGWNDPMRQVQYVTDAQWDEVDKIREHLQKTQNQNVSIYLTTDSIHQAKRAQQRYSDDVLFTVEGPVTHADRSPIHVAAEGFWKVMLDNWLIGGGVHAVISNSGFSYTGVWRTRLNSTVVRMNKNRTGYFVEPHNFSPHSLEDWIVVPSEWRTKKKG
eukprot:TRINITY_DN64159_c0_g5_i1.p1 TRINITY_DN64159_c0_g5~~TRINITY_DN64159_c0_g5_i1.p1  ORF type:complete len:441 (-),score=8.41 TRINITY_DN64159_c0_g5_i1:70-1392(-)